VHFESKARATKYLKEQLLELWKKTTTLFVSGYMQIWSQFPAIFPPRDLGDDVWGMRLPVDKSIMFPTVDIRNVGIAVDALLHAGTNKVGGKVTSVFETDNMSMGEMVKIWAGHVGREKGWERITDEEFAKKLSALGFLDFLVEDMGDLMKAMRELGQEIWYADVNVKDVGHDSDVIGLALTWLDFV
jgi:hypothetical protein